jgi:hypothetical protein
MKTITSTELNHQLNTYLALARAEEIVIELDDGQLLKLGAISSEDAQDEAFESDPRFMQIIDARRQSYRQRGGIPLEMIKEEVFAEVRAAQRQLHDEDEPYLTATDDKSSETPNS